MKMLHINLKYQNLIIHFVIFYFFCVATFSNAKLVLTHEELKALDEFRPLVNNILVHEYEKIDSHLLRWLKDSKLNVKEALQKLKEAQKWKKENKIDTILNENFPEFSKFGHYSYDGIDFKGRTVYTTSYEGTDIRRIVLSKDGTLKRYKRFSQYIIEKVVSHAAQRVYNSNGTLTDDRLFMITDLNGFSIRTHGCLACINFFAGNAKDNEKYYPGVPVIVVYINTPRIALPFTKILLNLVSEETKNSTKIFGTNRNEWSKYLQKYISSDQLSYQYGGTKKNN